MTNQQRFTGTVLSVSRNGAATIRRSDDKLVILHAADAERAGLALSVGARLEFGMGQDGAATFAIAPALAE